MSGAARFARFRQWRLFVCGGVILLLLTMLIVFHNQQELDEKRELRLRSLNDQLQSILEDKYDLERKNENERIMQTNERHILEQKLKHLREVQSKDAMRYEKLLQSLQNKHNDLNIENGKNIKEHQQYVNDMEKKLQELRAAKDKQKTEYDSELKVWKNKLDTAIKGKEQSDALLSALTAKCGRVAELEHLLNEYKSNGDYHAKKNTPLHLNKPLLPPDIMNLHDNGTLPNNHSDTLQSKFHSFNKQELVSPGQYKIDVKTTNLTELQFGGQQRFLDVFSTNSTYKNTTIAKLTPAATKEVNIGLILNSVENFQMVPKPLRKLSVELDNKQQNLAISPLSAPRRPTSTDVANAEKQVLGLVPNPGAVHKPTNVANSTSSLLPVQSPPSQQRKLPENVAPIPAYFDDLLKNDVINQKSTHKIINNSIKSEKASNGDAGDNNNAAEVIKNDNDDKNNRYSNVGNDIEDVRARKSKKDVVEDSGAHEIKEQDVNGEHFNLPADDGNFFAGENDGIAGEKIVNVGPAVVGDDDRDDGVGQQRKDEDDDMLGVGGPDTGDIAVKNRNQLLDAAENLNNEVAGDQGKEFPADELRLEDGNDEDGDEDDYSNLAARQKGAQAIRN